METLTLDSPLTEEQWDAITDVDFDATEQIYFNTKHGKNVEFIKTSAILAYLAELIKLFEPSGIDINGRWVGGDEKLFYFVKELMRKIENWNEK